MAGKAVIRFVQGFLDVKATDGLVHPLDAIVAQGHDHFGKVATHALLGHRMAGAALFFKAKEFSSVKELIIGGMHFLFQLSLGMAYLAVGLLVTGGAVIVGRAVNEQPVSFGPVGIVAGRQFVL